MSRKRKKDSVGAQFLERANQAPISAELLIEVLDRHASMAPADRADHDARAFAILSLLDRKGLAPDPRDRASLAMSIDFRLTALARLEVTNTVLKGWTMPAGAPGMSSLHHDALQAAAEEPLIEDGAGQVAFDPESFQRRLLAITAAKGQA